MNIWLLIKRLTLGEGDGGAPIHAGDAVLLETADKLLLESGDILLLEPTER